MHGISQVRIASVADREKALATIVSAFATDPMARWSMAEERVYQACFPDLARGFAGKAFETGTVYYIGDFEAVAVWLAPGAVSDDEAMTAVLQEAMPEGLFEEGGNLFEQMEAFHPPQPHWYLPLIGVEPAMQGKGYGSMLMEYALEKCDSTGAAVYLESSNPDNIPFYERFGFKVLGEIQAGSSPVMFPMLRES